MLAILAALGLRQIKALKTQMQITRDIESRRLMFEVSDSFQKWVETQNTKWVTLDQPPRFAETLVRLKRDAVEVGYAEDYACYADNEYAELCDFVDAMYEALMGYAPQFYSLMNERGDELYHLLGPQFVLMMNVVCVVKVPRWVASNEGKPPVANQVLALHFTWAKKMGKAEKAVAVMPKAGDAEITRHVPEWTTSLPLDFDKAWGKGMSFTRSYDLR
ncbi:hypothetical protein [Achromobacter sp. K91]|uniref:hypothetical protein n=1 Tax=Achromobacter sp. K91 TaxID=2292262 RepID=UPI0011C410D1|nr:hypothetical protein [Achromobacter sp. K91]